MPMSERSGMKEALREVVDKEIMVVVISQCEFRRARARPRASAPEPARSTASMRRGGVHDVPGIG